MALIVRRFNVSNPAANTRTRLYTVPTGKKAILRTLTYSSDSGTSGVILGTTIDANGFIWSERIDDSYSSKTFQLCTVMNAGQYMDCEANSTNCYFVLQVAEMDEADGANLVNVPHLAITTTKSYVVPSGKRLRLREQVISPHGAGGLNISTAISSNGYVLRATTVANNSIVNQLDLSVNPGETLASHATSGTVHAWYSGVLEDA